MANAKEVSITLPAELVERARALAQGQSCSVTQLIDEALHRYEDVDRLNAAIQSGEDRLDALDDFLMDYVVRMVHEARAERRAEGNKKEGELKAS